MQKKVVVLLSFVLMSILTMASCAKKDSVVKPVITTAMKAGVYVEDSNGMQPMSVEVTLGEKEIRSVKLVKHAETPGISDPALERIPQEIVAKQAVNIDAVAGATRTSAGILNAVKSAITKAGGNVAEFAVAKTASTAAAEARPAVASVKLPSKWDYTYDVVVVGSGFAGLSAAYSAKSAGAKTLLVEKMPRVGGNSAINGGVYAAYTSKLAAGLQQKFNLVPDTAEKHIEDTIKGGDFMPDPLLVRNFVLGSPFILNLLLDNGLQVRESLTRPGGHYGYRTYTTLNGIGGDITKVQYEMVQKSGVEVMLETKMVRIYRDSAGDGAVAGIQIETKDGLKNVKATKGVVLATGGFSANKTMRRLHVPTITDDMPTTNHPGATGEGLIMAQEVGANTIQMSYIQLYPFAEPNTGTLDGTAVIPFSSPSAGVVYVDVNGKRYVNEGERRDVCANAAMSSAGFPTFSIVTKEVYSKSATEQDIATGMANNRIFKADTLEELAAILNKQTYKGNKINMDGKTLAATIAQHNTYVRNKKDPDFNKVIDSNMVTMEKGPYYGIPQWPSVHHTMGGLSINPNTQVLDVWGEVIPNLYAAGEVVGGVHGTNRLGSNATPDASVHGFIAGQYAASRTLPDFLK